MTTATATLVLTDTPIDLPAPTRLTLDRYAAPVADLVLVTDEQGALRMLSIGGDDAPARTAMTRRYSGVPLVEGTAPADVRAALDRYFAGDRTALDTIPVAGAGTPFQRRVWAALRAIPAGATASYRDIATALGDPKAVRAVGMANGANPIAIVVPCHRVIAHDGSLGGYSGGLDRKRWLLAHEGIPVAATQAPLAATDRA